MSISVNLLPPKYRRDRRLPKLLAGATLGAAVAALLIWATVLAGQVASLRRQAAELEQAIGGHAAALTRLESLKALEARVSGLTGSVGKPAVPRSAVINEALRLAGDTRVLGVRVDGSGAVVINGEGNGLSAVGGYLERLGQSQILSAPVLTTVRRGTGQGALSFEVTCRVAGGGANR